MRKNPRLFRLSATVAIGALLCNPLLVPTCAVAQPAPPAARPDQPQGDPPARVGRIASQSGAVSFRTSADTQWSAAAANYPVSAGNAFWTEPTARAELEISASHIDLAGQTELDVTTLADSGLQAVVPQGEVYLHLVDLAPNEVWSVDTPRGTVRLTGSGRYDIAVGTTDQPTLVTVLEGAAEMEGPGVSLKIAANQTATVTGTDTFQGNIGAVQRDAFLAARLAAERPPSHPAASIPAQLSTMSGGEDLAGYGEWSQVPDYGDVWYPPVAANWVPYREGDWAYVAPWGWTWIDSDPWGFAPFHYGRWAHIGSRWGWIPGERTGTERPVYAPALVTFLGLGAGVAVGAAIARGSVGWVPLGPHEAYHPWYHASENYLRQINTGHVKDLATIGATIGKTDSNNNFVNRAGATSVPASVMMGSRSVRGSARPIAAAAFASARPVIGQQPVRPGLATLGVTPAVARQLDLRPGAGEAPRHPAPGPVVRAAETGAENGHAPRPALVGPHGEQPGAARPGEPAVVRPETGRAPGAAPPLPTQATRPAGVPEPGGAARPEPGGPPRPDVNRPSEPEGARPGQAPETSHEPHPPLATPAERPPGPPERREVRPGEPPHVTAPPEVRPGPERGPPEHLPAVEHPTPEIRRPTERAPEPHEAPPPRVMTPEAPHPAPPPHVAAPEARPMAPPRAPEPPRPPPPPHVEQARPAAPPPHVEQARPAAPPPHVEQARPAAPPPPRAAPPPPARPAPGPERKPGEK